MAGLSNLLPLIILFVVVGGGGYIGYHIYLWSNEMTDRGKKHMEKKNMSFTKDGGLKVGVKEKSAEAYTDKTQK
jgi:exopolysaccharide biosynthesis protein